jgi:hypothetical protein
MILAKELLEKGEKDIVIKYLDLCRVFWVKGTYDIEKWEQLIKQGGIPNFGVNLLY